MRWKGLGYVTVLVMSPGNRSLSRPTIHEVARLADVSPATVSRVLNDDPRVGTTYRERVQTAVEQLSYQPNRLARNLRRQRSGAIAVVVPDITNVHFSETIRTIEAEAYHAGHHVLVCATDENPDKQASYLDVLLQERVLGVIISPSDPFGPQIARLIDQGIPVVALDREVHDPRADAVVADNVAATRDATNLLIDAGHRDIALISGRREVETGAERLQGYEAAMVAAGLTPRWADGGFRAEGGYRATTELMGADAPPTGLVVANNLMTVGTLSALQDLGTPIPGRVALVAIDEPNWASLVQPSLTTVAQPVRRMALDAMELLSARIAGDDGEPRRRVHPFELVVRGSSGGRVAGGS
jgi:LacI family transcriptional regulator